MDGMLPYDLKLKQVSRQLRNNATCAEKMLWDRLRKRQLGQLFYRQKPVGEYIADFYCPKAKLVIEVDGRYHADKNAKEYDKIRDEYIEGLGLTVIRFTNSDIIERIERVLDKIADHLIKKG